MCLVIFGIYTISGRAAVLSLSTLTSLFEQFLVALATNFCRKPEDDRRSGNEFPSEVLSAISSLQALAYRLVVSKEKLMTDGDVDRVVKLLRTATEKRDDVNIATTEDENEADEREIRTVTHPSEGRESNESLLRRTGILHRADSNRWSFTCNALRDFLAARHLSDTPFKTLDKVLEEQKVLRHARFSQMAAFLCGLFRDNAESPLQSSLVKDMTLQVTKSTRRVSVDKLASSGGEAMSEDTGNDGVGRSHVMSYVHTLQALAECSHNDDLTGSLVRSLPKSILLQRDGLFPTQCLAGLALAVKDERSSITHVEVELLPYHGFQGDELLNLAEALAANSKLQTLIIRWQNFPLMVAFLKAALKNTPSLDTVLVQNSTRKPISHVSASTWVSLHEVAALLRNTVSFFFMDCTASIVLSHLIPYLPNTIQNLDFSGCVVNNVSAAALGSKVTKTLRGVL